MPAGRPPKFNPLIANKIIVAVRGGNYLETAAAHAGISKQTLYDWLHKGANGKRGGYAEFSDAVQKAMADAELRDVVLIGKAAEKQWQAAAWRLERKFPDRWGRKDRHLLETAPENPLEVQHTATSLVAVLRKMLERNGPDKGTK